LQQLEPKHIYTLHLLQQVYLELSDWPSLESLLPLLYKYKVQPFNDLEKLEAKIYEGLLLNASKSPNPENISAVWDRIPRDFRIQPSLLITYVKFLKQNNSGEAEQLLKNALQKQWDNDLVYWYGKVKGKDPEKQLKTAEAWLKTQANNPQLLFSLGRLCMNNQLWGKARSYFEASLTIVPNPEAYQNLATLLEQLGETQNALDKYKEGLRLACEKVDCRAN
jgi:HemY protein